MKKHRYVDKSLEKFPKKRSRKYYNLKRIVGSREDFVSFIVAVVL